MTATNAKGCRRPFTSDPNVKVRRDSFAIRDRETRKSRGSFSRSEGRDPNP